MTRKQSGWAIKAIVMLVFVYPNTQVPRNSIQIFL